MKYYIYIDGDAYCEIQTYNEALEIMSKYDKEYKFLEIKTTFPKRIEVNNEKFKYDLRIFMAKLDT